MKRFADFSRRLEIRPWRGLIEGQHVQGIEGDVLLRGNGRGLGQYSIKIANREFRQWNQNLISPDFR